MQEPYFHLVRDEACRAVKPPAAPNPIFVSYPEAEEDNTGIHGMECFISFLRLDPARGEIGGGWKLAEGD